MAYGEIAPHSPTPVTGNVEQLAQLNGLSIHALDRSHDLNRSADPIGLESVLPRSRAEDRTERALASQGINPFSGPRPVHPNINFLQSALSAFPERASDILTAAVKSSPELAQVLVRKAITICPAQAKSIVETAKKLGIFRIHTALSVLFATFIDKLFGFERTASAQEVTQSEQEADRPANASASVSPISLLLAIMGFGAASALAGESAPYAADAKTSGVSGDSAVTGNAEGKIDSAAVRDDAASAEGKVENDVFDMPNGGSSASGESHASSNDSSPASVTSAGQPTVSSGSQVQTQENLSARGAAQEFVGGRLAALSAEARGEGGAGQKLGTAQHRADSLEDMFDDHRSIGEIVGKSHHISDLLGGSFGSDTFLGKAGVDALGDSFGSATDALKLLQQVESNLTSALNIKLSDISGFDLSFAQSNALDMASVFDFHVATGSGIETLLAHATEFSSLSLLDLAAGANFDMALLQQVDFGNASFLDLGAAAGSNFNLTHAQVTEFDSLTYLDLQSDSGDTALALAQFVDFGSTSVLELGSTDGTVDLSFAQLSEFSSMTALELNGSEGGTDLTFMQTTDFASVMMLDLASTGPSVDVSLAHLTTFSSTTVLNVDSTAGGTDLTYLQLTEFNSFTALNLDSTGGGTDVTLVQATEFTTATMVSLDAADGGVGVTFAQMTDFSSTTLIGIDVAEGSGADMTVAQVTEFSSATLLDFTSSDSGTTLDFAQQTDFSTSTLMTIDGGAGGQDLVFAQQIDFSTSTSISIESTGQLDGAVLQRILVSSSSLIESSGATGTTVTSEIYFGGGSIQTISEISTATLVELATAEQSNSNLLVGV